MHWDKRMTEVDRYDHHQTDRAMPGRSRYLLLGAAVACRLGASPPALAQSGAKDGEWHSYGGDLGSTRYSPLDQINASNFSKLEVAWRFKTDSLGPRPEYQY